MPLFSNGQSFIANVWDVRPDSVCPGDSLTVLFKMGTENQNPPVSAASLEIASVPVWTGTWAYLKARPKEKWPTSPDSVRVLTVRTPTGLSVGSHPVRFITNGTNGAAINVYAKNCACTITAAMSHTVNYQQVSFESTTIGTSSATTYFWDFGEGHGFNPGGAVMTWSYNLPGTYTVGLQVVNPTCQDTKFFPVTATANTTGLSEHSLKQSPIYFDLLGNRTEKRPGVILIEQTGLHRRKVLIQ